jgi:hypothetical protein
VRHDGCHRGLLAWDSLVLLKPGGNVLCAFQLDNRGLRSLVNQLSGYGDHTLFARWIVIWDQDDFISDQGFRILRRFGTAGVGGGNKALRTKASTSFSPSNNKDNHRLQHFGKMVKNLPIAFLANPSAGWR